VYRDGTVAILPGTQVTEAFAVSDDGTVVGTDDGRPVVWRPSAGEPSTLPMPDARCPMPDARCPMPDARCRMGGEGLRHLG
jgi:hypothetical protein